MDPSETQRVTAEFEQATRTMFDRLPDIQRNALKQEYQEVVSANKKKEDVVRQYYDNVRKMLTEDLRSQQLGQAQYEQAMDETRKREQAKIRQFQQENEQTAKQSASRMSQFADEAMKGAAQATGIAGILSIAGIIAQVFKTINEHALTARMQVQMEALSGGQTASKYVLENLFSAARDFGVEPERAGQMATGFAATRRMSPENAATAAAESMRLARGAGMDPTAVVDMQRQLLERGALGTKDVSPDKLREAFVNIIRTADQVGAVYTDLAKNALALNDIVRPMGFSFDQATNMVAGFNDEIREGKVSVAALGDFMSSVARAPLGTQAYIGTQILQNEGFMSQLGPEGQALLKGARSPFEVGAAVKGMAFGEYGGTGAQTQIQSIMRQMVTQSTQQLVGTGAHETAQAEMARMLLTSLGLGGATANMGPKGVMKLLEDPEEFKKAMEDASKDPNKRLGELSVKFTESLGFLQKMEKLLTDMTNVILYGFGAIIHLLTGKPEGGPFAESFRLFKHAAGEIPGDIRNIFDPMSAERGTPEHTRVLGSREMKMPTVEQMEKIRKSTGVYSIQIDVTTPKGVARTEFIARTQGDLTLEMKQKELGPMSKPGG
jgi:hypothetical protein